MEESYCIVKELVMTERTYKKDLELITNTFRQFAITNNFDLSELPLFDQLLYPHALEPILDFHTQFLKDLEIRLFFWTDKANGGSSGNDSHHRIGDLLGNLNVILQHYRAYVDRYDEILSEMDAACKKSKRFDALVKDFEAQKACYLPLTMFLIKPIQRLVHYKLLFERLLIYYGPKHRDYMDTYNMFAKIEDLYDLINEKLPFFVIIKFIYCHLHKTFFYLFISSSNSIQLYLFKENKQKLMELQRDLVGIDNFFSNSSKSNKFFIREGSLQKLSRKGYLQRMFFLVNSVQRADFFC
jgi:FERM/RhoGEF/pleckstrin domain protein 2